MCPSGHSGNKMIMEDLSIWSMPGDGHIYVTEFGEG